MLGYSLGSVLISLISNENEVLLYENILAVMQCLQELMSLMVLAL